MFLEIGERFAADTLNCTKLSSDVLATPPKPPVRSVQAGVPGISSSELLPVLARTSAALGEPPYSDALKQQMLSLRPG
jgi:hypothetical protein